MLHEEFPLWILTCLWTHHSHRVHLSCWSPRRVLRVLALVLVQARSLVQVALVEDLVVR